MRMEKVMTSKTVTNKRGSYILEATISLPIFLIATIVMCSIILMYACIEDANFIAATELRRGAAEAIGANTSLLIPFRIEDRIKEHSQVEGIGLRDYGYRAERWGQDELIAIKLKMKLKTNNPLDLAARADYDVALVTRAYVGKDRKISNMSAAELMNKSAKAVYIFPKSGEKYHSKGCGVLHANYKSAVLTASLKNDYSSCPVCHSGNATIGTLVYYFPTDGKDYHLAKCQCLERNYIEVDIDTAIERGYKPCGKCGG